MEWYKKLALLSIVAFSATHALGMEDTTTRVVTTAKKTEAKTQGWFGSLCSATYNILPDFVQEYAPDVTTYAGKVKRSVKRLSPVTKTIVGALGCNFLVGTGAFAWGCDKVMTGLEKGFSFLNTGVQETAPKVLGGDSLIGKIAGSVWNTVWNNSHVPTLIGSAALLYWYYGGFNWKGIKDRFRKAKKN